MSRLLLSVLRLGAFAGITAAGAATGGTVGAAAAAFAGGVVGNRLTDLDKLLDRHVAERFLDGWSEIDENHHVSRGLRLAQINALRAIINQYGTAMAGHPDAEHRREARRFSGVVKDFLDRETDTAQKTKFSQSEGISKQEQEIRLKVLASLPEALDGGLAARRAPGDEHGIRATLAKIQAMTEAGVLEELSLQTLTGGETLPPFFLSLFEGRDHRDGWFDLFIRDAAAKVKDGGEFEQIWNAEQLALVKAISEHNAAVLNEMNARAKSDSEKISRLLAIAEAGGMFRLAEDQGISEAAIRSIVERLGYMGVKREDLLPTLEKWIEDAVIFRAQKSNEGEAYEAAFQEAWRRFNRGQTLEASDAFMEELAREQKRDQDRQAESKRKQIALLEGAIQFDARAFNETAIIQKLRLMAKIESIEGPDALGDWLFDKGGEYYEAGDTKGTNPDLFVALAAYRTALEECSRVRVPSIWAATLNNLGNGLQTLGKREGGTARLEEAVTAYRAALEERTRDRVPLDWAMTQNNLGNALQTLGARESGTALLEEAVTAYRAALEEQTRERVPLDWAMTQNNLGTALQTLGTRESGTARLEESVTAYRAALEEYTRERVPFDWAMTQNNLGAALQALGERESGTARLEEAIAAYRAALEERTRDRVPLDWAGTQNNLGNALSTLGERESGTARLEEAVTAYRAALEERTRERVPLDWAMTQNNLGTALETLGERETGTARLEEAVTAYRAALEEHTPDRAPYHHEGTQQNLAGALNLLAARQNPAA